MQIKQIRVAIFSRFAYRNTNLNDVVFHGVSTPLGKTGYSVAAVIWSLTMKNGALSKLTPDKQGLRARNPSIQSGKFRFTAR